MDHLTFIKNKIVEFDQLDPILARLQFQGKKIVFTNGCFDLLHRGHVEYLATAASHGDFMVIGLNSDSSIKNIKGPNRPIQDEIARALILSALSFVGMVVLFSEDTPYELIKKIQPDVLVKGADYKAEDIVGYDIVKKKGGSVITVEIIQGYSTTLLIQRANA